MRITTGSAKGRKLLSFTDVKIKDGRRPTSDYIKQAIFSRIQFDIEGRNALDLFAGTGQLGLETLSRGASSVDFVDTDISTVTKNIENTGFSDKSAVIKSDALIFLKSVKTRYDLIFLDPPYNSKLMDLSLCEITAIDILNIGGIIVCESQKEHGDFSGYRKSVHKHSGKVITLYRRYEVEK